jgi:excisionase family DNA binding protein
MDTMSAADAARYLGTTPRTVYKLIDSGRLTPYPYGRGIVVDRDDLDRYRDGFEGFDGQMGDREPRNPLHPFDSTAAAVELPGR